MKIAVGLLIEDLDVYPRERIDSTHVSHIADAIEAGVDLPPIVADEDSKRITDGFHRARALKRVYGEDYKATVQLVKYASEADLFADAVRLNSAHGNNITQHDRVRCMLIGERLGIAEPEMAAALNITTERMNRIKVTRIGRRRATAVDPSGEQVALKYPVRHMAGTVLTAKQAGIMPDLGGNQQTFYVNQLIKLISCNMLDTGNERLIERLGVLHEALHTILM